MSCRRFEMPLPPVDKATEAARSSNRKDMPAGRILAAPLEISDHAAHFVLPMRFVDFSGELIGGAKYPGAPAMHRMPAWPAAAELPLFV